ncbi:hypothetical protein OV203_12095 [Nannocystis sp. ILAH1]|uniref:hypothetical protein n=1 Tax=unclassified Nannocystis TaxID=2627009 RepID=UPI00226F5596|nr:MULTISPECIES: hypothetical protein [unclassified Nannocystis]MCY0987870.1 hypothetical protein [Nannocystis sp. ILAH1]MCY1070325.1 hypothetical protein [Nannocystis sp. RBIL2]
MGRPATLAAAVGLVATACNGGSGQETGFSSSITTAPPGTSSSGSGTSSSTSTSTSAGEDSAAASSAGSTSSTSSASSSGIPDVGMIPDGGDGPPPGCKGKVDIVFTISSAKTMEVVQTRLKASFPGFVTTLESEFGDFDYHILSANTSALWGHPVLCADCKDVCPEVPEYPCGVTPEPCDTVQGAGVTYPIGKNASNKRCDLASGLRYITPGQPELEEAFTCVASMGTNGADQVAEATVKALADGINGPGGCNEGFLRDDALLVVVAIQDTYDQESEGTPEDWRDALVVAKGGDADAVVLLVISTDKDDPAGLCGYKPSSEHALRTWTELMQPNAKFGSACAMDYVSFFDTAATMIKSQCDVFVPQ